MCDFKDVEGNVVEVGDTVEHWKTKDRQWITYTVESIEIFKTFKYGTRDLVATFKVNLSNGTGYYRTHVKQPNNLRKIS